MALTAYCSPEEVRAALGVNSDEVSDDVLALPVYAIGLVRELNKISTSLPAAFSTAADAASPTETQQALIDAVRFFSVYSVARQLGVSLPMIAPKDVGDGKATLSRWAGTPYENTMFAVKTALEDARAALVSAFASYQGVLAPSTASLLPKTTVNVGRSVDPVTGS